jgi:citrate synthase
MSAEYNFFKTIFSHLNVEVKDDRVYDLCNAVCSNFIEFTREPIEPPSSCVVALAANSGASFPNAAAAGLSCISDKHLLINEISSFIEENYQDSPGNVYYANRGRKLPGFGHPSIKGEDERVRFLMNSFRDLSGPRTRFFLTLERLLGARKNSVHMNIGGAMSCLLLDVGIPKECVLYFPLVGRMFGWLKIFNETNSNFDKVTPSNIFVEQCLK